MTVPSLEAIAPAGRSNPEQHFRSVRVRGGGAFDRAQPLHWIAVLWNAARVHPDADGYLDAQATAREALATLCHDFHVGWYR